MLKKLSLLARLDALYQAEKRRNRIGGFGSYNLFAARVRAWNLYRVKCLGPMKRTDIMEQWLEKIHARCLWEKSIGKGQGAIACYQANGFVFLVQVFNDGSWNIFTSHDSGRIDQTLDDAESRLKIIGERQ
jgi:hypothetical protein